MGGSRALFAAAALAIGASLDAFAIELLPRPMEPPEAAVFGAWHLRGNVGAAVDRRSDFRPLFGPTSAAPAPLFNQQLIGDGAFVGGGLVYAADAGGTNFAWAVATDLAYGVATDRESEFGYRSLDADKTAIAPISCHGLMTCPRERRSFDIASQDIRPGFRYMPAAFPRPRDR